MKKLVFILFLSSFASCYATYNSQGWQWYNKGYISYKDLDKKYDPQPQKESDSKKDKKPTESATKRLAKLQADYKESQAEAVLNPTVENVSKAASMRLYMINKSKDYATSYQKALLQSPELSHQMKFPTQQYARKIYEQEEGKKIDKAIKLISDKYGLFFFYKGDDPYAAAMAKQIQQLANSYGFVLIGISMDGKKIPKLKDQRVNSGQAEKFGVKAYPALFIADPKAERVYPLSYGFISTSALKKSIYNVATNYGKEKLDA